MMLYQFNVILSALVIVGGSIVFLHYISINFETLFEREKCESGFNCVEMYLKGAPKPMDKDFIEMVREKYLVPPPKEPDRSGVNIYEPVWRKLVDWYKVQENLMEVFKDQPPGVFVEVGAVDGNFMSQTLFLEKNLSWTGVLIEPDPRSFEILSHSGRNAWLSPLCVYYGFPSVHKYWLRTLEEGLPHHFTQLLMARSKLDSETLSGDEKRGGTINVPCTPLTTVLKAVNITTVDIITIATGTDNDYEKIMDATKNRNIDVKSLLIHYPTSRLYTDPYPHIPGYILDARRSQMLVKFYVKLSHCQLVNDSACEKVRFFDVQEACFQFFCFDYLSVKTFNPQVSVRVP